MKAVALLSLVLGAARGQPPLVDHHQHLFSPGLTEWAASDVKPITAKELVAFLDSAGIRRALVLSVAYQYGNPSRRVDDEYERVRAENDWTSQQVAQYPNRLRAFCGVNPLKEYALREIERCAKDPRLRAGLKLHFGNSDVDLHDSREIEQVRRVFRAANASHMSIVVHMHPSVNKHRPYGTAEARIFLDSLLPSAPDVFVQIAHLSGAGNYDDSTDHALAVFAEAIAQHDSRTTHLYFDTAIGVDGSVGRLAEMPSERSQLIVARMRRIGLDRILFGCDSAVPGNSPRECWTGFQSLPLTDSEIRVIANNVAPYMR